MTLAFGVGQGAAPRGGRGDSSPAKSTRLSAQMPWKKMECLLVKVAPSDPFAKELAPLLSRGRKLVSVPELRSTSP